MCNCKGWDIAFYPEEVTIDQHFCRLLDDCGHADNTLEEAADEVAAAYLREHAWYTSMKEEYGEDYNQEHADKLLEQEQAWRDKTHTSYHFYKNQVDIPTSV